MPLENEENIPYGFLNPVDTTYGPGKSIFNVDNQPFAKTIREIAKERFTRDVLGGVSEFVAVCLAAAPKDLVEDVTTSGLNAFGVSVQANSQIRFFGRIPEIHAHLPLPRNQEDMDVIRMYPLFVGSVELGDPGIGQLMRVSFKNVYNQEGPIYLGPAYSGNKTSTKVSNEENNLSNSGGAATALQTDKTVSRYVEEPLTPSNPKYKEKLDEKMKDVYRPYGSESKNNSKYDLNIIPRGPIFQQSKRDGNILNSIIVHETGGNGPNIPTENGLIKNGTGVHFMVDQDGTIFSYNDPKFQVYHANEMNSRSIGIEVINIYNAYNRKDNSRDVVYGMWISPSSHDPKSERSYLVPTKKCLESVFKLVKNLCINYQIPIAFPSVLDGNFVWGQSPGIRQAAGICQHQCFSVHADGAFLVHYIICRFNDMTVDQAYNTTIKNASTTKRGERTPLQASFTKSGFGK